MSDNEAIKIVINGRFPAEVAVKRFKRLCESAGVLKEYKKRKEYKKPSIRRKEKLEAAQKRKAKEARRMRRGSKI